MEIVQLLLHRRRQDLFVSFDTLRGQLKTFQLEADALQKMIHAFRRTEAANDVHMTRVDHERHDLLMY